MIARLGIAFAGVYVIALVVFILGVCHCNRDLTDEEQKSFREEHAALATSLSSGLPVLEAREDAG